MPCAVANSTSDFISRRCDGRGSPLSTQRVAENRAAPLAIGRHRGAALLLRQLVTLAHLSLGAQSVTNRARSTDPHQLIMLIELPVAARRPTSRSCTTSKAAIFAIRKGIGSERLPICANASVVPEATAPRREAVSLAVPGGSRLTRGRVPDRRGSYWITSVARASVDGGITSPSASAVRRFTTNSNTLGRSIGRSPGRAPFRILSTYVAARR